MKRCPLMYTVSSTHVHIRPSCARQIVRSGDMYIAPSFCEPCDGHSPIQGVYLCSCCTRCLAAGPPIDRASSGGRGMTLMRRTKSMSGTSWCSVLQFLPLPPYVGWQNTTPTLLEFAHRHVHFRGSFPSLRRVVRWAVIRQKRNDVTAVAVQAGPSTFRHKSTHEEKVEDWTRLLQLEVIHNTQNAVR